MPRVLRKSSKSAREGEGRERVWTTRWKHRDAKGCSTGPSRAESEFCKTKRKGSQPSSPSRQILLASLALPPAGGGGGGPVSNHSLRLASFHSSPPLLSLFLPSFERSGTVRSRPFLSLPPPPPLSSLSSSSSFGREPARILNRDHYLRAIIIPKTNSYFLLRNRKLINQSSLALSLSPAMLLAPLRVARGPGPGV